MKIIVFSKENSQADTRIHQMITAIVPRESLTVCRSQEDLTEHLSRSNSGCGIIVLLLEKKMSLTRILTIKDLFWSHKMILVLPDMERETIVDAVKLFPRYMTQLGTDFSDVKSVLIKLLKPKGDGHE